MAIDNEDTNPYEIQKLLPDITETEEGEGRFPLPKLCKSVHQIHHLSPH